MSPHEAFRAAVEGIGSQQAMAELIGFTQPAISKRLAAGKACPSLKVLVVEAATGISRYDLRPDIYPREAFAAEAEPAR